MLTTTTAHEIGRVIPTCSQKLRVLARNNPPISMPAVTTMAEQIDRHNGDRAAWVSREDRRQWEVFTGNAHTGIGVFRASFATLNEARDWARRCLPTTPLFRRYERRRDGEMAVIRLA